MLAIGCGSLPPGSARWGPPGCLRLPIGVHGLLKACRGSPTWGRRSPLNSLDYGEDLGLPGGRGFRCPPSLPHEVPGSSQEMKAVYAPTTAGLTPDCFSYAIERIQTSQVGFQGLMTGRRSFRAGGAPRRPHFHLLLRRSRATLVLLGAHLSIRDMADYGDTQRHWDGIFTGQS